MDERLIWVYAPGVCDLFHWGHVDFFRRARELGDRLIVGVPSEATIADYKPAPVMTLDERVRVVAACRYVDRVVPDSPRRVTAEFLDSIGAAFAGSIAISTTSGPGFVLKQEALGLAVMAELPVIVVDVQRAGPSTGMPTKNEQADLLLALFGRNSDSPLPVLAPATPGDCFHTVLEAVHLAVKYMTPVIFLSDGGIGNAAEPWRIPDPADLPPLEVKFRTDPDGFQPYARDGNLARAWVRPGTPGMEHRVGGLEKDFLTGNISHDPVNHQRMVEVRARLTELEGEQREVVRIVAGNGSGYGVGEARTPEFTRLAAELEECLEGLAGLGVQVKDPETGLLDFPARRGGEDVLLCWRVGEDAVEWWHGLEDGFAGRRRIDWDD